MDQVVKRVPSSSSFSSSSSSSSVPSPATFVLGVTRGR
jgi:hypothetical protein